MKTRLITVFIVTIARLCFGSPLLEGLSEDEKTVMLTILAEARGEGEVGMYAVACVIQQRVRERHLSAAKVCTQRLQFSCWNGKSTADLEKTATKTTTSVLKYARELAHTLVFAGEALDRSRVGFANHYCTLDYNPKWSVNRGPVIVVKNHKFYRL